jgi:hypothetical protein
MPFLALFHRFLTCVAFRTFQSSARVLLLSLQRLGDIALSTGASTRTTHTHVALSLRSSARERHTRASPMLIPARRSATFPPPRRSSGYECPRSGEWMLRNPRIANANANANACDVV